MTPKEILEVEKLRVEIKNLKRSEWWKPSTITTIFFSGASVFALWYFGAFDYKSKKLDADRSVIEWKTIQLKDTYDSLSKVSKLVRDSIKIQRLINDSLQERNEGLNSIKARLDKGISERDKIVYELNEQREKLQKDLKIASDSNSLLGKQLVTDVYNCRILYAETYGLLQTTSKEMIMYRRQVDSLRRRCNCD